MKYFALTNNNSVVAKWADPRTVTFTSKSGRDAEVSEIVQEFELLRDYDVPMYTEEITRIRSIRVRITYVDHLFRKRFCWVS